MDECNKLHLAKCMGCILRAHPPHTPGAILFHTYPHLVIPYTYLEDHEVHDGERDVDDDPTHELQLGHHRLGVLEGQRELLALLRDVRCDVTT